MNELVSANNYAQLVTISGRENDASEIESHLRKTGLPVRMTWIKPAKDIVDQLRAKKPDMIFCDQWLLKEQPDLLTLCSRALPYTPVLLLANEINTEMVTKAMRQRARDVVSADMPDHLHAVYLRELGVCRLQQQLINNLDEIDALEERLKGLVSSSEAAVINVQEGIIVEANARFAVLFGYDSENEALGLPFLDQIAPEDQKELKTLMSRCMKGRKFTNNLKISALNTNGSPFAVELELKLVHFDGESAIELLLKADEAAPAPAVVVKAEETKAPAAAKPEVSKPEKVAEPVAAPAKPKAKAPPEEDPRVAFYRSLEDAQFYPPKGSGLSMGYFVVDNSAKIKKQLGLAATDEFLGRVITFLMKQQPGTKVYRLGTDEFVLLAPGKLFKHGESMARNFCKQISDEVFDFEGQSVMLTVSIAITLIDLAENSGPRFTEARDTARRISAADGNDIEVCKSAVNTNQTQEPIQFKKLQNAVENNRVRLATRPISSLEGDARTFYEIYSRIPDDKGGFMPIEGDGPQDSHSKLQIELDKKIIQLSLGILKQAAKNGESSGVLVPISSCSLEESESIFSWLVKESASLGLKNQHIVFTLSEEVLIPHIHRLKGLIAQLDGRHIYFAISDCAGNAESIKLIQNLPCHYLRLTTAATKALCNPKNAKADDMHEAVSIAREKGYKIIAAAIGDAHSMAVLWQLGVSYVEAAEIEEPAAA